MSDEKTRIIYSVNQVVAWNLWKARREKGWTQAEATQQLAPYLGEEWSVATYSAAERSAQRFDRVRQFNADDLVAFAATFGVPVQYFFVGPTLSDSEDVDIVAGDRESCRVFTFGEYMRIAYGSPAAIEELVAELQEAIEESPDQWGDDDSKALRDAFTAFTRARVKVGRADLEKMHDSLEQIGDFLYDLIHTGGGSGQDEGQSEAPPATDDD